MGEVTVCVATYGDSAWQELAERRAGPSAAEQAPVVHVHGTSLHGSRNAALERVRTEWVVFLDADDELAPDYVERMLAGSADVRAPAVSYIRNGRPRPPYVPNVAGHRGHACTADCLPQGNWLVVGSMARTELVREVGGWRDFPWSEDWDLWLRCRAAGATFEQIPAAVYRAWVRRDSRNRAPDRAFKLAVHDQIYRANFGAEVGS